MGFQKGYYGNFMGILWEFYDIFMIFVIFILDFYGNSIIIL